MLGAAAGLMTMARWQNALFVVFPVVDALRDYVTAWPSGTMALRRVVRNHGGFILAGVAAFSPQMWFWHRVRGNWLNASGNRARCVLATDRSWQRAVLASSRAVFDESAHVRLLPWVGSSSCSLAGIGYLGGS